MSYELITRHNSRNFTPAASVPATYGRQRTIDSITIHWWGLPEWNATFEGTTDFLCTNNKPTSAHEVIEAGRVAVIVNHGDASWAAGNAVGNATSIHLELNPRASDADYATAAERIRDIRAMHGKDLPLIPHRTWQATMCPGHYDLDRLDRTARGSTITPQGTTTPTEEGFLMALTDKQQEDMYWMLCAPDGRQFLADLVGGRAAEKTLNTPIKRYGSGLGGETNLAGFLAWNDAHVDAIVRAVGAVAPTADLEAIKAAVREGLAAGVQVNATVTFEGGK